MESETLTIIKIVVIVKGIAMCKGKANQDIHKWSVAASAVLQALK